MQKLYEKSKLHFALLWILIYVVGTSIADELSRGIGLEKSITAIWLLLLTLYAAGWLKTHGLRAVYGLCKPALPPSALLCYLPLVLLASCNLWYGVTLNFSISESLLYVISMICVGFLEELIFRGFLFRAMADDNISMAIILSSVTFGLGHIVNLFNGSGAELLPNLCQICYAIAIGFAFVMLFIRTGSLWPCIITHAVVNVLSAFADQSVASPTRTVTTAILLTVISLGYALWLHRKP